MTRWLLRIVPLLLLSCSNEQPTVQKPSEPAWFMDEAIERGVSFTLQTTLAPTPQLPEIVAGGAAAFDYDNDGFIDLYLVQATGGANVLLHNTGDGTFEDVSAASGTADPGFGMGVATADVNGDGFVDLYITNVGANVLLLNNGDGSFRDATSTAGVGHDGFGASATFFDADGDGDLDLFLTNYVAWSPEREIECRTRTGELDYCAPVHYQAPSEDVLYRNNGDASFTNITAEAGLAGSLGNGLGVVARDFTGDGAIDLFIANDGNPDRLWVNDGRGHFTDRAMALGCDRDMSGKAKAGMGVVGEDVDDDGDIDVIVCNLVGEADSLYENRDGTFVDVAGRAGIASASRRFTRFGLVFGDFDNDGLRDLFEANGRVGTRDPAYGSDPYAEPNVLLRGKSDGTFSEVRAIDGETPRTSRAAVALDVNNDGGLDLLIINREAPAVLLMNRVPATGHWVTLDIRDANGAPALGASVRASINGRLIYRFVHSDGSYLAASDPRIHVGLGDATSLDDVQIIWRDGTTKTIGSVEADRITVIAP